MHYMFQLMRVGDSRLVLHGRLPEGKTVSICKINPLAGNNFEAKVIDISSAKLGHLSEGILFFGKSAEEAIEKAVNAHIEAQNTK